jgi:hypothetical protein
MHGELTFGYRARVLSSSTGTGLCALSGPVRRITSLIGTHDRHASDPTRPDAPRPTRSIFRSRQQVQTRHRISRDHGQPDAGPCDAGLPQPTLCGDILTKRSVSAGTGIAPDHRWSRYHRAPAAASICAGQNVRHPAQHDVTISIPVKRGQLTYLTYLTLREWRPCRRRPMWSLYLLADRFFRR